MNRGFRVFDKKKNQMIYKPTDEGILLTGDGYLVTIGIFSLHGWDKYIRIDSTGSLDENGVEVYDGDILKCPAGIFKVEWHGTGFWMRNIKDKYDAGNLSSDHSTVIGNIYQNPELLK